MKLERTLTQAWVLHGSDVPALAAIVSRGYVVVVDDVEWLCASLVVDLSQSDAPYAPRELADLYECLAFLLGRTVEVLDRYDPTRGRRLHDPWTDGFRAWLHDELRRDLIDHCRSWFGRHGQKRLNSHTHTDGLGGEDGWEDDVDRAQRRGHRAGVAAEAAGDRSDVGGDALRGLLEGGDRQVLREVEALGLGAPPGARAGAAAADRTAAGGVRAAA